MMINAYHRVSVAFGLAASCKSTTADPTGGRITRLWLQSTCAPTESSVAVSSTTRLNSLLGLVMLMDWRSRSCMCSGQVGSGLRPICKTHKKEEVSVLNCGISNNNCSFQANKNTEILHVQFKFTSLNEGPCAQNRKIKQGKGKRE